jgi:predicted metal-binding membrane protein
MCVSKVYYMAGNSLHQSPDELTARIAERLRDSGIGCEVVSLVPAQTAVLRRDRVVIVLALALLTALAWSYLLWLSADLSMGGMDMTGFRMIPSGMALMVPADTPWLAGEFALVFIMWTVMMVGMMTPSAAPMFLTYARTGRQTEAQSRPLTATIWFAIGYFLVWVAFALLATLVQWVLERTALLDFRMASTSDMLGGLVFLMAGLYQCTRLNEKCLIECQRPFAFVMRHGGYRRDAPGCVTLGVRHGAYCVGCCGALMVLLLVGGVMNVLWIILLTALAFFQRVTSTGRLIAGMVLIACGVLFSMGMS